MALNITRFRMQLVSAVSSCKVTTATTTLPSTSLASGGAHRHTGADTGITSSKIVDNAISSVGSRVAALAATANKPSCFIDADGNVHDAAANKTVQKSSTISGEHDVPPSVASSGPDKTRRPVYFSRQTTVSLEFETAKTQVKVAIAKGDLTKLRTDVIVNPVNSHLQHCEDTAKAVADAAGSVVQSECEDYIESYGRLQVSEVMHTTAGNLNPPIKHIIHAFGPNVATHPDKTEYKKLLERTFHNCLVYANDNLHAKSVVVPAISSGTGVSWDIVSTAAYNALQSFDAYMASFSQQQRYLKVIAFVNVDRDITVHFVDSFAQLVAMSNSLMPHGPSVQQNTSDEKTNRTLPVNTPRAMTSSDTSGDSTCCVCRKTKTSMSKKDCGHTSCTSCLPMQCIKCLAARPVSAVNVPVTTAMSSKVTTATTTSTPLAGENAHKRLDANTDIPSPKNILNAANSVGSPVGTVASNKPSSFNRSGSLRDLPTTKQSQSHDKDSSKSIAGSGNTIVAGAQNACSEIDSASTSPLRRRSGSFNLHDRKPANTAADVAAAGGNISGEVCSICLNKIAVPKRLDCGHKFCTSCITEALSHSNKCPRCVGVELPAKGVGASAQPRGSVNTAVSSKAASETNSSRDAKRSTSSSSALSSTTTPPVNTSSPTRLLSSSLVVTLSSPSVSSSSSTTSVGNSSTVSSRAITALTGLTTSVSSPAVNTTSPIIRPLSSSPAVTSSSSSISSSSTTSVGNSPTVSSRATALTGLTTSVSSPLVTTVSSCKGTAATTTSTTTSLAGGSLSYSGREVSSYPYETSTTADWTRYTFDDYLDYVPKRGGSGSDYQTRGVSESSYDHYWSAVDLNYDAISVSKYTASRCDSDDVYRSVSYGGSAAEKDKTPASDVVTCSKSKSLSSTRSKITSPRYDADICVPADGSYSSLFSGYTSRPTPYRDRGDGKTSSVSADKRVSRRDLYTTSTKVGQYARPSKSQSSNRLWH